MTSISIDRKAVFPLLAVLAVFTFSRMLYDRAGIQFQGDTYLGYWQFMDVELLQHDLWRSVFYLHSQPPLMNLLTGIVLQGFPEGHVDIFHLLYFIAGLILAVCIYGLGIFMRLPKWISAILSILFMTSPSTVLYEHWLAYALPLATLLTLAGVFLYRFASTGNPVAAFLFFACLALVVLTWSLFHLLWFIAAAAMLIILSHQRKKVILAALLPALLVTGWYAKNLLLVGEFTSSSWTGMNLSKIVTFRYPEKERRAMVRSGELSKFALIPPFRNPAVYLKLLPATPLTGIPLLDEPDTSLGGRNHHHLVYVESSQHYLRDALHLIILNPQYYLRSVWQALYIYFHSASDYDLTGGNRNRIRGLDIWWNRLFYFQWESDETSIERNVSISVENVAWGIVLVWMVSVLGGLYFLWNKRAELGQPRNLLLLFMTFNILYVTLIGTLMDIGENNRFRYVIDPFLMIVFVFLVKNVVNREVDPGEGWRKEGKIHDNSVQNLRARHKETGSSTQEQA